MTSPILMFGGKNRIAPKLVKHFPVGPKCYVEPFFGSGAVFYAMPPDLYNQRVINDKNSSITTFFRVLRDRPEELISKIELTPYAFDEQRACRDWSEDPADDLEVARRVWVRQRQNFGASNAKSIGWRRGATGTDVAKGTANKILELPECARELIRTEINNDDGRKIIDYYGKEGAFVYSDPPYHPEARQSDGDYAYEMSVEDHEELGRAHLAAAKRGALVMVSGYDCAAYQRIYSGWRRVEYDFHCIMTATESAEDRARKEVVWMNYGPELELQFSQRRAPKAQSAAEVAILKALTRKGKVR